MNSLKADKLFLACVFAGLPGWASVFGVESRLAGKPSQPFGVWRTDAVWGLHATLEDFDRHFTGERDIQQAAESHGKSPQQYSDEVSAKFQELFDKSGIAYDDFIRTTEPRHHRAVEKFWETLSKRGYIYRGQYEGWYCVSDEAFLTEEEVQDAVTSDGNNVKVSVASGQPVTWMTEENYMFRLSAFKQQLLSWLDSGAVRPVQFEALVRDWVDDLRDLSVSRQRERLSWGIPVPGDNAQTVYVWLDALVNYLTVAGYPDKFQPSSWPPTCQVIGKDILR
nr:hypothetical protein BaRGS_032755 [Batillaria attramentaria]